MTIALSERARVGLDAARAAAAVYVVLHHWAASMGYANGPGMVFRFGQEAVIVFFLLSGFVIFANERDRAQRPKGYYLRRLRRIYPMLAVAMALSVIIAFVDGTFWAQFSIAEFFGTLASLQDIALLKPGVIVDPFLGNDPLWSLSYEVAFYLVFPPVLAFWRRMPTVANHVIGVSCCGLYAVFVFWPNHFVLVGAYFLMWWCGAMAAHAYLSGGRDVRAIAVPLGWLLAQCVVAGIGVAVIGSRGLGYFPVLQLRHFAVAAVILVAFFGPLGRVCAKAVMPAAAPIAFVASISFGLYVFHYPLLVRWQVAKSGVGLILAVVVLVLLATFVERTAMRFVPKAPRT